MPMKTRLMRSRPTLMPLPLEDGDDLPGDLAGGQVALIRVWRSGRTGSSPRSRSGWRRRWSRGDKSAADGSSIAGSSIHRLRAAAVIAIRHPDGLDRLAAATEIR